MKNTSPCQRRERVWKGQYEIGALVSYHSLCCPAREGRHDFFGKLLQLFQNDALRRSNRMGHVDALQARVGFFELHELLDDLVGWPAQNAATLDRALNGGQSNMGGPFGVSHSLDLLVGEGSHQA